MSKLHIEREQYINKTFKLNVKLLKEMEKIRDAKYISLNKLVDICLRFSIEHLDRDDEDGHSVQQ